MLCCKRLLLVAACTRAAYLAGNLLLAHYVMDYDTSASLLSDSCDDAWPEAVATVQQQHPWVVWDSVFMHRLAICGYEYEQFFAFFPAFPGLVRLLLTTVPAGLLLGPWGFTLAALAVNNGCFLVSVWLLARLSEKFLQDEKLSSTAVMFFIMSPASIHHSLMYSEALFTASSWLGLYCLYCRRSSLLASLAFAVSAGTRSNGLLNAGFLFHEHGRRFIKMWPRSKAHALMHVCKAGLFAAIAVAPYFAYTWFGYSQFCAGAYAQQQRPWCNRTLPSVYGYVQDVYWNVGFLRYYEWNQVPNFLLAAPTLLISLWGALAFARANPHLFITGGLLTQQQLSRWFSSSSSSSSSRNPASKAVRQQQQQPHGNTSSSSRNSSSSCSCADLAAILVGYKQMVLDNTAPDSRITHLDSSTTAVPRAAAAAGGQVAGDGSPSKQQSQQKKKNIPGVAYQSLRERQLEVSCNKGSGQLMPAESICQQQQQQQQYENDHTHHHHQQQQQQDASITSCSCTTGRAYYSPAVAVFIIHWLFLTLVCLAVVHIQVSTRFLSSCVPLYWFAAALMLYKGGLLRWLLWWYCFAFMGVGAVLFTNFYPWT